MSYYLIILRILYRFHMLNFGQSAGTVEYTDCFSTEG